jgi:hypothetical protein
MEEIITFLQNSETGIYLLVGVLGLFAIRKLVSYWREGKRSTFGLERESTQRSFNASLVTVIILVLIAAMEFIVVSFVAPAMPKKVTVSTPTIDFLATLTVTVSSSGSEVPGTVIPTMTLANISEGCVVGKVEWTLPTAGERISGKVTLKGLVKVTDLGFYKYEYSPSGNETWTTIGANTAEVFEATWDVSGLSPGDYRLRLVVSDTQNRELPPCIIVVNIAAP